MRTAFRTAIALLALASPALADTAADYAALTAGVAGQVAPTSGSPGSVALHGRSAFPVVLSGGGYQFAVEGAGTVNDDFAAGARGVAYGHTGWFDTSGGTKTTLYDNAVLWASRKATPAQVTIGLGPGLDAAYFQGRGYTVKSVSTAMASPADDLSGCDVFVGNWHRGFSASAVQQVADHAAAGKGVVLCATPWALSQAALDDANRILGPFGLTLSGDGPGDPDFTIAPAPWPAYHSALPALDWLIEEKQGTRTMTLAEKTAAANAVDQVLASRPDQPEVLARLETLSDLYGWILVTAAAPLRRADSPVEAMLARYQSRKFDTMPADQLFAHPCAADWPGAPAPGTPVTRTIRVSGNAPPDTYVNQGWRGVRVETGLYAAPGTVVTVTIPAGLAGAGLEVETGIHIDENFHLDQWNRFPKVVRRDALAQEVTRTGCVFGGLVHLYVPEGAALGDFDVTIEGALEAPVFTLGATTNAEWIATRRDAPGAWGYIDAGDLVAYASRRALSTVTNAQWVAEHWRDAMATADRHMGYEAFRRRGESALTDRDIVAGYGHAGYPVMMAYWDSTALLRDILANGDWGFYHELGHGYQDDFDGNYTIATHAEVDVNLVPGILYTLVHDRTAWDGPTHGTFDGQSRLDDRNAFLALPAAQQTWDVACQGRPVAYDFYFNLAEAFGWQAYGDALGRLMRFLQSATPATDDPELASLDPGDPNYRRNRLFLVLCRATGHDLTAYFDRYGLGRGSFGITQSVKDLVAGDPVWTDNRPPTSIAGPPGAFVREDSTVGTPLATFTATDPEPGTIFTWSLTAGNADGAFTIDRRTGVVRTAGLDFEAGETRDLTVTVQDNGVPRFSLSTPFSVTLVDVPEPPRVESLLVEASSAQAPGAALATLVAVVDAARTLASWELVGGDPDGLFTLDPVTGELALAQPARLPAPGVLRLQVRATDSATASGMGCVFVLCNQPAGVRERRWSGSVPAGAPDVSAAWTSFASPANVGASYVRKVTGWIVPPSSGLHTFWISSDDDSHLLLSDGSDPARVRQVASVSGWTGAQQWDAQGRQRSEPVWLEACTPYFVEAVHWEGGGGDHVEVAWSGPGFARRILDARELIPEADGLSLPAPDTDLDGVADDVDCGPLDPTAWSAPGEPTDLRFVPLPTHDTLTWQAPAAPGGTSLAHDVLRSASPSDFSSAACAGSDLAGTTLVDATPPTPLLFYLVRAQNACGASDPATPGCP